jgi:hypothetical protein
LLDCHRQAHMCAKVKTYAASRRCNETNSLACAEGECPEYGGRNVSRRPVGGHVGAGTRESLEASQGPVTAIPPNSGQSPLDLHIALGVEPDVFDRMLDKARAEGIEVRGPVDHGFVRSIYMRDPNGYVVELTASTGVQQEIMDPAISKPHEALARWQTAKAAGQSGQTGVA